MQQSIGGLHSNTSIHSHLSNYGPGSLTGYNHNFTGLKHHIQQIPVSTKESLNDPLGVAERGKVGMPPSSSECSSNSSMLDASFESTTGLVNGIKKGINYYSYTSCSLLYIHALLHTKFINSII